jgi:hypothetical protein
MTVAERLQTNDGDLYALHEDNERFGLIIDRRLAIELEAEHIAKIVPSLGNAAVSGASD